MARRGDALYLRGRTWYLDCTVNGVHHQRRLGKGITRSVTHTEPEGMAVIQELMK